MQAIITKPRGRTVVLPLPKKSVYDMNLLELKKHHQELEAQAKYLEESLAYASWKSTRDQKSWVSGQIIKVRELIEAKEAIDAKIETGTKINPEISFEL